MQFVIVAVPSDKMPAPPPDVLPEIVLPCTVRSPSLIMPPPHSAKMGKLPHLRSFPVTEQFV
ncbi:MAG: hypothetical protein ACREFG_02170, partial [Chthoniobacterales bacterium]